MKLQQTARQRVTGCPREVFVKAAEVLARNSGPERTGAICYAVGWTHHTTGVQMRGVRATISGSRAGDETG